MSRTLLALLLAFVSGCSLFPTEPKVVAPPEWFLSTSTINQFNCNTDYIAIEYSRRRYKKPTIGDSACIVWGRWGDGWHEDWTTEWLDVSTTTTCALRVRWSSNLTVVVGAPRSQPEVSCRYYDYKVTFVQ